MVGYLMRRPIAAAAGLVLALGGAAAVAQQVAAAGSAGSAEIAIENFAFSPETLTVAPGTAVTWSNHDEEPHNIVNVPGAGQQRAFRSQAVDGGEKYSFVFNQPGTYSYICSIHPHMQGTVVVK
ncbi:MAG TPA: cupredoxin family copper-binding protein [Stellaceae bacterium]